MAVTPSPTGPTVYVIDDDASVQHSLTFLLESAGHKAQAFASAEDFLAAGAADAGCLPPAGCIVLDLRMPKMNGEELLRELKARGVRLPVIVLTGHGDVPQAVRMMKLGAWDFLQKPADHAQLLDLVKRATDESGAARPGGELLAQLTPRERDILDRLCAGKPTKRIAFELSISVKTVEHYRSRLLQKFGASNVAELVYRAVAGPGTAKP